ncbi:hypothetical protein C3L33_23131, partial [Rhododendron williamsianum]
MTSVPVDGKTVKWRGDVEEQYHDVDVQVTQAAFKNGWYRTTDLGVRDLDGDIRIKDRAVDTIFKCEGDPISTLEIEAVLVSHPAVEAMAVVERPNDRLGESRVIL